MMFKKCPTCKQVKDLSLYNRNKSRKDGYQRECRECCHNHFKKHYHSKKSPRLKEELKPNHKKCNFCKQIFPLNFFNIHPLGRFGVWPYCKSCCSKKYKIWKNNGGREWENNYTKNRKNNNPQIRLKGIIRLRLSDALKKYINGNKIKFTSSLNLLGCTIEYYKNFIESKFYPEMHWGNWGKVWEIDHIIPCHSFDLTKLEEQQKCFHYTNTQPLFKTTNIALNFGYVNIIGNRNKK